MLKPRHDSVAAVKRILSVKTVKHDFVVRPLLKRAFAIVNWYKSVIKPFIFIPSFLYILILETYCFSFPSPQQQILPVCSGWRLTVPRHSALLAAS